MKYTLEILASGGLNNFIKISSTLKRKQYKITHLTLDLLHSDQFHMEVSFITDYGCLSKAIRLIKKNEDVYEIIEKME
jgi:hypothetical protein